jgi:alanine racemase
MSRRAVAEVSTGAIARNVERLTREVPRGTHVAPVVKAEGYGHGALIAARAAGTDWLCVATADEALALRRGGVSGRILVLGAIAPDELPAALEADADVAAWDLGWLALLPADTRVHVKLDTGMGRLGTRDPAVADAVCEAAGDRLAGVWTHFATADERGDGFFGEQLERFRAWADPWRARRPDVMRHCANSAAILRDATAHCDLVRPGIAIYGMDPFGEDALARGLEPALRLTSWAAAIKRCPAGASTGYGRRFVAERDTVLATVPVGYGDGWRRALTNNAEVVIGGRRFPLVGTVSMDNITVDLGPDGGGASVGDEVVLLGDGITAEEVAGRLKTINYEVTTGLLPRVRREEVA